MTSLFTDDTKSISSSSGEQDNSKYSWRYAFVEDSGQPVFMEAFDWKDPEKIESTIWDLVSADNEIDNKRNEIKKIRNSIKNDKIDEFDGLEKIAKLTNDIEWLNVIQTDAKLDSKSGELVTDERTVNSLLGDWYIRKTGSDASDIRKKFYQQLYDNFNNMESSQQSVLSPARPRLLSKDGSESSQEDKEDIRKDTIKKLKTTVKNVMKTNEALKKLQGYNLSFREGDQDNLTSLFHSNSSQDSDSKDSQDSVTKSEPKKKRKVGFGEEIIVDYDRNLAPTEIQRSLSLGSESRKAFQNDFITTEEEEEMKEILSNASVVSEEADKLFRDADLLTNFPALSPFPIHQKTDEMQESLRDNNKLPNFKLPPPKMTPDSDDEENDINLDLFYPSMYDSPDNSRRTSPTGSIIPDSPFSAFKGPLSSPKTIEKKSNSKKGKRKIQSKRLEPDQEVGEKRKRQTGGGKKKKTKKKSKKKKKKTRRKR